MKFEGKVYREDGMWKIDLILPDWVVDDVLRDGEHSTRTVIRLHDDSPYTTGVSQFRGGSVHKMNGKSSKIIATVLFQEENVEPQ